MYHKFPNPKQSIAVAYSMTKRKFPRCKRVLIQRVPAVPVNRRRNNRYNLRARNNNRPQQPARQRRPNARRRQQPQQQRRQPLRRSQRIAKRRR